MKVRNKTDFPFAPLLGRVNFPHYSATCTVKATYALGEDGTLAPLEKQPQFEGDVPSEAERPECLYAADLVPYKPRADLLLRASCHTPGGKGVTACTVKFAVGDWSKELAVIGNRTWDKGLVFSKMTDPEEFNRVDLTWANAFGGEKFALNPAGKGRKDGQLPNVEYQDELIKSAGNQPTPASYGPIDRSWKQRASKLGTYDKKWRKERWPAYPADLDWTHFNAAPLDQQVSFLRGDETFTLTNMHPEHATLKGTLPGLRMRCMLRRTAEDGLSEHDVPMNLDTLHIDATEGLVTLVWRGVCNIALEEGEDVLDALVWQEALADDPATIEQVRPWLEEPPSDAETMVAPPLVDTATDAMEGEALAAAFEKVANDQLGALKAMAPAAVAGAFALQPGVFTGFGDMRSAVAGIIAKLKGAGQPVPPELTNAAHALDNDPEVLEAETDMLIATALSFVPTIAAPAAAELAAKIRSKDNTERDFAGADLSGQDLSGADLGRANFTGAKLSGANLSGCTLDNSLFVDADLSGANLAGAKGELLDFKGANLAEADLSGAQFAAAVFDRVHAPGLKLTKAELPNASFAGAELGRLDAAEAVLKQADFSRAGMDGANFEGADLSETRLIGAKVEGGKFKGAKGAGLRAADADLMGADFEEAELPGAIFENANLAEASFRFAALPRALFINANLEKAVLFGAVVRGGSLRKANLAGAQAGNADFFEADFEKSNLKGASLITSNCYGAAFREADTDGADMTETNLKQTLLA